MKCNEIRNLVLAYLDSELDAKTSQEIQLHLQTCTECAELFKREEKFNERLFVVLRTGQPTPALWEKLETRLRPEGRFSWCFPRWKVVALGSLAALLVTGFAFVFLDSGASSLELAQAVAKDHREFIEGKMAPQFTGALPDEIAKKLDGGLDASAFTKLPAMPGFRSEGSRLCYLHGVTAAWTVGHYKGVPVSLIVFAKSQLNHFPGTQQRLETGEPIVCTRTGGFQFAIRFSGRHVVCAIADSSKQMLENLIKSVSGPG